MLMPYINIVGNLLGVGMLGSKIIKGDETLW